MVKQEFSGERMKDEPSGEGTKEEPISKRIVGNAYKELTKLVKRYAKEDIPILLVGETGTGKELFAKLYMEENIRKGKRLTVSCAEITETLLQSEIFGHVKGAFTDATANRKGKLATCDKGVLFLDELGKASKGFQALILRVAEQNSFSPVGSDEEKNCDVRIIAATSNLPNVDDELRNRFNCLSIPPLQVFDIPVIAEKYLGRQLKGTIIKKLMSKEYPGNVRQLQRECDQLKAERGEEIFGTTPYQVEPQRFDYDRFRFEYELWFKYIQPILDKHAIKCLKYTIGSNPSKFHKRLIAISRVPLPRPALELQEIVEAILLLTDGGEFDIATLVVHLRKCISEGSLSLMLNMLNEAVSSPTPRTTVEFLDFTHLLEYPFENACKRFEVIYLGYFIKLHGDIPSAAAALKMNEKTLWSRIDRARKAIRKD